MSPSEPQKVMPLPCPFCGDHWSDAAQTGPEVKQGPPPSDKLFVQCYACGAEGPWVSNYDTQAAVLAWNTRPTPSPAPADREGWEPIDTAPKDEGVEVLAWNGTSLYVCRRYSDENDAYAWFNGDVYVQPTHWRKLPSPPHALGEK